MSEYLERLASNPHYKMTPKQIRKLEEYRAKRQQFADVKPPKHDAKLKRHKTFKDYKNERADRDPLPDAPRDQG